MKEIILIRIEVLKDTNLVIIKYIDGSSDRIQMNKEKISLIIDQELKH